MTMSFNLVSTIDSTRKQIKLQYVAAAAGLALAVCSVVAVRGWESDAGGNALPASAGAVAPAVTQDADTPQVVFYLVDSQEQAAYAASIEQQGAQERASYNAAEPERTVQVLFAGTESQQAAADNLIGDWTRHAEGVAIYQIDLRNR